MFVITSLDIYSCGGLSLRMQRVAGFQKGSGGRGETQACFNRGIS